MAHFAKVLENKVVNVIVAEPEFMESFVDSSPGEWIQTSYNTLGGVHYQPGTNTPSEDQSKALRGNYAGIGYVYDSANDVFYKQQPHDSWTLNQTTWIWEPPVAHPNDGKKYLWNEETKTWDLNE
jgi:hypothetical protein